MPNVFRLAYVDLATPSLDGARGYYQEVLGLVPVETAGGTTYLSLGLDHHNLALHQAPREGLGAIGLQVSAAMPLADLAKHLGSGLVDQSQKMTVAARATAEKKAVGQRS